MPRPSPTLPLSGGLICRVLVMPNELEFVGAVNDCLVDLTIPEYWESNGDELVQHALEMLNIFWASTDNCSIGKIEFFPATIPPTHLALDGSTHNRADYTMLWDRIPATWQNVGDTFTLPNADNRYLKLSNSGTSFGGRQDFTLSSGNIPNLNINYIGASPALADLGTGAPVPSATPSPMTTSTGSLFPSSIDLDPQYIALKPAIYAKFA